jgi:hypothetical protein
VKRSADRREDPIFGDLPRGTVELTRGDLRSGRYSTRAVALVLGKLTGGRSSRRSTRPRWSSPTLRSADGPDCVRSFACRRRVPVIVGRAGGGRHEARKSDGGWRRRGLPAGV